MSAKSLVSDLIVKYIKHHRTKSTNIKAIFLYGWWFPPIPSASHVVATTTLVTIGRANCVCCTSRPLARYREVLGSPMAPTLPDNLVNRARQSLITAAVFLPPLNLRNAPPLPSPNIKSVSGAIDHGAAPREGLVRCSTHNLRGQW